MRWIVLAIALLFSTGAHAQCSGVFPNSTMCGNLSGAPGVPAAIPITTFTSAQIDAVCAVNNNFLARITGTWQCGSFGTGLLFSGGVLSVTVVVGAGIDQNILNAQAANYTIANTDCGKTIQAGTGSTGFFKVTVPATAGFSGTCSVKIVNGDSTNGKAIGGLTGVPYNMLWPKQSATVKIINGAWAWTELPGRWVNTSATTFNVDPVAGCATVTVPTCDGLGTGADAFNAVQTAVSALLANIDTAGFTPTILLADGTYTEQVSCTGKFIGITEIFIQGVAGHKASVIWNVAATGAATGFFFKDYCAIWIDNMTINVANSAIGVTTNLFGNVDVGPGMVFGSASGAQGTTGTAIIIGAGGYGSAVGAFNVNGSFNYVVLSAGGWWSWSAQTITGAASLTWATAFMSATSNGTINAAGATFSGFSGVSGPKYKLTTGSTLLTNAVDPNSFLPGSTNGNASQSTLDFFQHTFATLPAGADGVWQIADGKASNCGDSACSAFGTTVTGGAGALNLLVRWNGTNWTLTGK